MIRVCFWGVRGSIPTPGPSTIEIGGNTACVEVLCDSKRIILDGGTGLRALGDSLMGETPLHAAMFFSHMHWDHIQGFPFFKPALAPGNHFDLYGGKNLDTTLSETLSGQMNTPNFPLTLEQMASRITFHEFHNGEVVELGDNVNVKALSLNHPNGCYGYRIEHENRIVTYCSDTEHSEKPDENVLELAQNADIFIYDAQYTPEEYVGDNGMPKIGWGHSTFKQGVKLAEAANAKKLVLFHHDPAHTDEDILEIERRCREIFANADAAREGLRYEI